MVDSKGSLIDLPENWTRNDKLIANLTFMPQEDQPDFHIGFALSQTVTVPSSLTAIKVVRTNKAKRPITARQLARNWGISVKTAERTVEATTQNGIRDISNPTLSRRFRTNDRQL
jgi:hypothetical protein